MNRPVLTRLLVAGRGEIACRVMRTAKALGLGTVAVHSEIDRDARHSREADTRVNLGGSKASESYLDIDKIIGAARDSGAQGIHPGYGFLSENADFARRVVDAGMLFLGPPAAAIDAMGSKSAAKALMSQAGVPLVPGYHGQAQDLNTFTRAAEQIGYPVLLKASAGGGGKGMKVVEQRAELAEAVASAQREAGAAFGDTRLLLEKYLLAARHVEIQVFADQHGHCLYLNERDCSIQRRHQKVVEEAPAPDLNPQLRQAMGEAAVRAAQAIGYVGAGTVEFLLDARGEFFFMEMNTRLQVEHPVTEAITGLDLVAWQIRVALGEPLPLTQAQVPLDGHAIEVRLYAEDPAHEFVPATGTLSLYRECAPGPGRRIDMGVSEGDVVSPWYDPMLGKLIAWGEDREQARLRLLAMLDEFAVAGVKTNLALLRRIVAHPAFAAGQLDTGFIARHATELLPAPTTLPAAFWEAAAQAWLASEPTTPGEPWSAHGGLRLGLPAQARLHLCCEGQHQALSLGPGRCEVRFIRQGDRLYLHWDNRAHEVTRFDAIAAASACQVPEGGLAAPMNGNVVRVAVTPGQAVKAGDLLLVIEAMKMEHGLRAPHDGVVQAVHAREGEGVVEGGVLVEMV